MRPPALLVLVLATAPGACYRSHAPRVADESADDARTYDCPAGVEGAPEVCGDGIDQDCDGADPPCPADACADSAAVARSATTIRFPDPGGCPWSSGDNDGPRDGVFRARVEQVAALPLPAGAVLCGLHVQAQEDDLVFDDELIIELARTVLVQSFDPSAVFEADDEPASLFRYRWADLRGARLPTDAAPYCLGESSECALPRSEQHGRLALSIDGPTGLALGEAQIREGTADLVVVTTGDNNRDTDCRHAPFDLVVTLETASP